MTILEMLDLLETRIAAGQMTLDQDGAGEIDMTIPVGKTEAISPSHLRMKLESAGLSKADFMEVFGTPAGTLQNWLTGKTAIPHWVAPSLRIFEQLPPAARRKFLNVVPRPQPAQAPKTRTAKHPFSKIEEL